jgi:hypothetical protein
MSDIKSYAKKEMLRMTVIFEKIKVRDSKMAKHFFDFASNYFKDGLYFFKEKKYIESFEAFIISWSYVDSGLKLKFFAVPKEQRMWFTV